MKKVEADALSENSKNDQTKTDESDEKQTKKDDADKDGKKKAEANDLSEKEQTKSDEPDEKDVAVWDDEDDFRNSQEFQKYPVICSDCSGHGYYGYEGLGSQCWSCNGKRYITPSKDEKTFHENIYVENQESVYIGLPLFQIVTCERCNGSGKCPDCLGCYRCGGRYFFHGDCGCVDCKDKNRCWQCDTTKRCSQDYYKRDGVPHECSKCDDDTRKVMNAILYECVYCKSSGCEYCDGKGRVILLNSQGKTMGVLNDKNTYTYEYKIDCNDRYCLVINEHDYRLQHAMKIVSKNDDE